jgi:hypothetical protein
MEEQMPLLTSLFEKTEQYAKTNVELLRLKALDKSADVVSNMGANLVVILFLAFSAVALNIGIAFWLGDMLKSNYLGFFIVSGFYAVLALLFFLFRKSFIKKPLRNTLIKQFIN